MLARCINRPFRDLKANGKPLRKVGEEWEATPERIAEINSAGYGVMAEAVPEAPKADASAMTRAQLAELAESRGIAVPPKATKAEIAALLSEE